MCMQLSTQSKQALRFEESVLGLHTYEHTLQSLIYKRVSRFVKCTCVYIHVCIYHT